jgi:hypothetical protein
MHAVQLSLSTTLDFHGSAEDLASLPKGKRYWWCKAPHALAHGTPFVDIGRVSGTQHLRVTVDLPPGRYTVGCGETTRHVVVVAEPVAHVPPTFTVHDGGRAVASGPSPVSGATSAGPVDPQPTDPHHIRGAAPGSEPFGVTYERGDVAFSVLSRLVMSGAIPATACATGEVAVTRGAWPDSAGGRQLSPRATVEDHTPSDGTWLRRTDRWGVTTHTHDDGSQVTCVGDTCSTPDDTLPGGGVFTGSLSEARERARMVTARDVRAYVDASRAIDAARSVAPPRTETPPAVVVVEPASVPTFTYDTRGGTVAQDARARVEGDYAYLSSLGMAQRPPFYAAGSVIVEVGRANLVQSYLAHQDMPRTVDALTTVGAMVAAEQREDVTSRGAVLRMSGDGAIGSMALDREYVQEDQAFGQLVSLHASELPRAGAVMSLLSAETRARVWNERVQAGRDITLRTRVSGPMAPRAVFAAVSPGYTALDADAVADIARRALLSLPEGSTARGTVEYNPERATLRFEGLFHADNVSNLSAGDVFKAGFWAESNDAGSGAIRGGLAVDRNLCLNLIRLDHPRLGMFRIVHRGDRATMVARFAQGIRDASAALTPFLRRWGVLRSAPVASLFDSPSAAAEVNVRAILSELAGLPDDTLPILRKGALPEGVSVDGIARDVAVETLLGAWRHEPGDTLADVVNAVTRLHTERVPVAVLASADAAATALLTHGWT